MSYKKVVDVTQPLVPHFFYPREGAVAQGVIGLGRTQTDERIREGELPRPVAAFEGGRVTGWFGWMLIALQEKRMARAEAKAAAAKAAPVEPAPVRKRKHNKASAEHEASATAI